MAYMGRASIVANAYRFGFRLEYKSEVFEVQGRDHRVTNDCSLNLSNKAQDILAVLAAFGGETVRRDELAAHAFNYRIPLETSVSSYVSEIRRELHPEIVLREKGKGYYLNPQAEIFIYTAP